MKQQKDRKFGYTVVIYILSSAHQIPNMGQVLTCALVPLTLNGDEDN
jgi:hypothetical protein